MINSILRKIFKIYKDVLVGYLLVAWLSANTMTFYCYGEDALIYSNTAFILLFCILIILMRTVPGFNRWLNKDFWGTGK